jgi:hypothetical protein
MSYPAPQPTLPATGKLLRMALQGTDSEFQQVARLCEDEAVALPFFQSLSTCRSHVDAWLAYLTEVHPGLSTVGPESLASR